MANQYLGLSLFIMLLSFFIILNSISNFEVQKAQPVLNSLNAAFSREKIIEEIMPPGAEESAAQSSRQGQTLTQVQGFFTSTIAAGLEAKQNRLGTEMQLRMPFAEFQKAIDAALTPPTQSEAADKSAPDQGFLPTLVSLLDTQDNVIPYRMDMVLNVPQNPALLSSEEQEIFKKRMLEITAIASRLEAAGMPARLISAGLGKGRDGSVDIYFRRHQPFNPFARKKTEAAP